MNYIVTTGGYSTQQFSMHSHQQYEIVFYVSGSGVLSLNGQERPVKKSNILIVPPNFEHSSISHDNLRYISLLTNKDQLLHIEKPIIFLIMIKTTDNICHK